MTTQLHPAAAPYEIIFDDGRVVVVCKQAGCLVIPGRGEANERGVLISLLQEKLHQQLWIVHRIDSATSGAVVFAKTAQAHRELCLAWEKHQVSKEYLAVVLGELGHDAEIKRHLKEFGSGRMGVHPAGKPASTSVQVVEKLHGATLVRVQPHTGRRHQIRVHLYSIGHPIVGDPDYGVSRPVGGAQRLMLHAHKLFLPEFAGGGQLELCAPLPGDFETELAKWRTR